MGDTYRCEYSDPDGVVCGKQFGDAKGVAVHSNSHVKRPCRWCGKQVATNGHTQHQESCDERVGGLPWAVFEDLVADLLSHCEEVGDGWWCVIANDELGAAFATRTAAFDRAFNADTPVVIVPPGVLTSPEIVERYRRRALAPHPDDVAPVANSDGPLPDVAADKVDGFVLPGMSSLL